MIKTDGKSVLKRINRRLKALSLSANKAGALVGSRDIVRSIRRQISEGKQHGVSTQSLERLAPVLKTTAAWLLSESGPEVVDGFEEDRDYQRTIPIKGYVTAGAAAHYLPIPSGDLDYVEAPVGATDETIALEIRGDSLGELFDRWVVFFDDVRSPVTSDLIGKLCVVGLADERVLVKKLKRAGAGLYDLLSNNEDPIRGVVVTWAARVKTMAPR